MNGSMKYLLDPDFRKDPPKKGSFCVRCQKPVNESNAIKVSVNWDNWTFELSGNEFLGRDCWRKIKTSQSAF